ncbi:hypothetical protein MGK_02558 [Candida albicans P57055]|nr:hypothetical protein MGK_02558 [Candida albicans P57055]
MFQYIKATQRNRLTNSLFSSTFAICVLLVGANLAIPCPVDSNYSNDSNEKLQQQHKKFIQQKQNIHQSNKENEI